MKSFLNTVAHAYRTRYRNLSNFTFVMPNKRSGAFLLKAFTELCSTAMIAPRIISISDFVANLSGRVVASRLDLLFRLFRCYTGLEDSAPDMTLEKFSSWGETILADFNEIDMQLADPDEIFKNVYDLNAIRSNFLSKEQKKVMVEYFGYSPELLSVEFDRFWQQLDQDGKDGGRTEIKKKFHSLWAILLPLYKNLNEELRAERLATTGGAYRAAYENIAEGNEPYPGEKIVFVGFNALSEAEHSIFRTLKKMEVSIDGNSEPKADFIWDKAPALFAHEGGPAMKFININSRKDNLPAPEWIEDILENVMPSEVPVIKVVAVPSNIMQAKVAGSELASIWKSAEDMSSESESEQARKDSVQKEIKNARIAVILPDENLLLPTLYSLPPEFSRPNLTMGFPLKQTPVISFVSLLRKLHRGCKKSAKDCAFFLEDVKDFLAHPYSRLLFDPQISEKAIAFFENDRRIMVSASSLARLGNTASSIFRCLPEKSEPKLVIDYLLEVMGEIKTRFDADKSTGFMRANVERVYIGTYTDALIRLSNCVAEYKLELSASEVFTLADRMIAGESVVFDGRPLEGLQIMGVLETRCLDFDKIIMLSVNEKVMPRVGRNSTFIPNIIRAAYNMPPANYQEELFAYYFFRILGRCESAILTFDSRSAENRTPGPSRYLLQMKYLAENVSLREEEMRFGLPHGLTGDITIEKNKNILPFLSKYTASGVDRKNFSSSALGHYFHCPLRFLYSDVLDIHLEREKIETINSVDLGLIVHEAIEHLYMPAGKSEKFLTRPILISTDFLKGLLNEKGTPLNETRIEREARMAILKYHFALPDDQLAKGKLRGSAAIIFPYILRFIRNIIETDLKISPFRIWGTEIKETISYTLDNGTTVSMKMVIDRLDQEGAEGSHQPFRIVDYKTGEVKTEAEDISQLFDGAYPAKNIFQLLFYAELLLLSVKKGDFSLPGDLSFEEFEKNLKILIYKTGALPGNEGLIVPHIGKAVNERGNLRPRPVETMGKLREVEAESGATVMGELGKLIETILDTSVPFEGHPTEERCRICDYRLNCDILRARNQNADVSSPGPGSKGSVAHF